jgi:tRNA-Thr(GGU) m(6)t(6)A37 methyltransferase TsaA
MDTLAPLTLEPIGIVRSPLTEKQDAARQPAAAQEVRGCIELLPRAELIDGLSDLEGFSHLWVIFHCHHNAHFRPKVRPPRSAVKRGVFATRSPYRPNPLGLSLLALERIEANVLHVRGLDILDGTPVLDLKPYLAYTDAVPDASTGWLGAPDPAPDYAVHWSSLAAQQLEWLEQQGCSFLREHTERVLRLGPAPHAYRRIRKDADGYRLAVRDFRVSFSAQAQVLTVQRIDTGYKPRSLNDPRSEPKAETPLAVHRGLVERFGAR